MQPKSERDEETVLAWQRVAQLWDEAAESLRTEQRRHEVRMHYDEPDEEPTDGG